MSLRNSIAILGVVLAFGWGVAFGQAFVDHGKEEIPQEFCLSDVTEPWGPDVLACTGEDVCFSGALKYRYTLIVDPNGRFHYQETLNDNALSGIGITTGVKYRRVGADTYTYTGDGEPPLEEHWTSVLNFIGPGPGNNFALYYHWKISINANGDVVAEIDEEKGECQ